MYNIYIYIYICIFIIFIIDHELLLSQTFNRMTTLKGSGGSSTSLPGNRNSFFKLRRALELKACKGGKEVSDSLLLCQLPSFVGDASWETPRGITAVTVMLIIFQLKAGGFGELCAAAWIGPCGQQENITNPPATAEKNT